MTRPNDPSTDRPLAPCPACARHVAAEPACPFCGAALATAPAVHTLYGRFPRAVVFAGAVLACSSKSTEPATSTTGASGASGGSAAVVTPPPKPDAPLPPDATTRARLVGRELTFFGQIVKGGTVTLYDQNWHNAGSGSAGSGSAGSGSGAPMKWVAKTDDQGFFTFEDLDPGEYLLEGGRGQHSIHLDVGTNHQDFVLPKPEVVRPPPNMPYGAPPARYRVV